MREPFKCGTYLSIMATRKSARSRNILLASRLNKERPKQCTILLINKWTSNTNKNCFILTRRIIKYEMDDVLFVIVTVSDSCYNKTATDRSGPAIRQLIEDNFQNCNIITELVPDEQPKIEKVLMLHCNSELSKVKIILTTGGTGFAPRDVTPEATRSIIKRECPQLALAMSLESFRQTPFAALSRAVCGIRDQTLIINMPGSTKAVAECFEPIKKVLPHIVQLMADKIDLVKTTHHQNVQTPHICPHKTGKNDGIDRNSPYPMLPVNEVIGIIFGIVKRKQLQYSEFLLGFKSPVDIPPFRASIKDGYALKSSGLPGIKKVLGTIAAGDSIIPHDFADDECYKINTGAPMPDFADNVIQIEDTTLLNSKKNGEEDLVDILVQPKAHLDVRQIGCDLRKGEMIFPTADFSDISVRSVFASVGIDFEQARPRIGIISTGSELLSPDKNKETVGKIFDSNTRMLMELLKYFQFECYQNIIISDDFQQVKAGISKLAENTDIIICTGGVSMGDKDYIKPVLIDLDYAIHFGRVNMKPGKPMTFASKNDKYFFGLPGNPVSAFVTFHLFVLPALRWAASWPKIKCQLAELQVTLENEKISLDSRPEYVRAKITNRNGRLFASVSSNQMSSRLQSIVGADVLLHLPGCSDSKPFAGAGDLLTASILRYDFISKIE